MHIEKEHRNTSVVEPLERLVLTDLDPRTARLSVRDAFGRDYFAADASGGSAAFRARGAAGRHVARAMDANGNVLAESCFTLRARTRIACDAGPYGALADRLEALMKGISDLRGHTVNGRYVKFLVCWLRDHTYVLKSMKYHLADLREAVEFFLDRQQDNGMIWDDIHENPSPGFPCVFGEALGPGYFAYEENGRWILRRIPVEADVEYIIVEAAWHVWKATGDDAWIAAQLPRLRRAIAYMTSHPDRWSARHGLVKRGYTMDSWDFTNPRLYPGRDHRHLPGPGEPFFLYHGDNSGCYSAMTRMSEMCAALGLPAEAGEWRGRAEALRARANALLWHEPCYAAMVPEEPLGKEYAALVEADRRRLSLGVGYTINRGLPDHGMAVQLLREYRRRREAKRNESFAEWWTMDPPYTPEEWPDPRPDHNGRGEYMNGSISPLPAGELARAAFEHGMEDYGADILRRLWELSERDGGYLAEAYTRRPESDGAMVPPPPCRFTPLDLRAVANVGLRHGATPGVQAWTGEGDNDLRNLPVGDQTFHHIRFRIIDPAGNGGRAVIALGDASRHGRPAAEIPVNGTCARSLYFLHATDGRGPGVAAIYEVEYADGGVERCFIRSGVEIGHWWGVAPLHRLHGESAAGTRHAPDGLARVAWQGANGVFGNVGLYMFGWNNPHPDRPIAAIRLTAAPGRRVMIAGISFSDAPVAFERSIRSFGLPETWAQAAVYHALAEGLAGIVDTGRAFSEATVSPRWAATEARAAGATLHYPASDGYVAYRWALDEASRTIAVETSSGGEGVRLRVLLPAGAEPVECTVDGRPVAFETARVENSVYACVVLRGPGGRCEIRYRL